MQGNRTQESSDPRPPTASRNVPTTEREDVAIQRAALLLLLDRHPVQLTLAELTRELAGDPADFAQTDAVNRAVADLSGAGLLHRHGDLVLPTRAAVHFDRLDSV